MQSHRKNIAKNPNARQYYAVSSFKKLEKDSGLGSITSIYGDSEININPEDGTGNQGMIQSRMNSIMRSGMIFSLSYY